MYSVSVFLHIVGALALFAGLGLEQAGLVNIRRASTSAQLREWVTLLSVLRRVQSPAALLIVATGFHLVATRWGHHAWIGLGLLGVVLMGVLGAVVTGRRVDAIRKAVPAGDGPIPAALRQRVHDPVLRTSASLRVALGLGIVFDMSVKPGTAGAFAAMGVALALGAVASVAGGFGGRHAVPTGEYGADS
ncbi:MAG TPA: hypothetical protein VF488_14250 [Gemmatimonadaceae bacterium]